MALLFDYSNFSRFLSILFDNIVFVEDKLIIKIISPLKCVDDEIIIRDSN